MKQIAGKEKNVPNALMVTKTLKKMIEEGRIVPGAQAGHSGAGSYKLSLQEKSRISKAEKVAAKKVVKKSISSKKVVNKSTVGKKVVKKGAKSSSKKTNVSAQKGGKAMKQSAKKPVVKAKKTAAESEKVKK